MFGCKGNNYSYFCNNMNPRSQKPSPEREAASTRTARTMFVVINVLVWVIILCFPFLVATRDGSLVRLDRYVIYSWIPLMFMLVFYFNYYYLVDKLIFEKRRWWRFLLSNFVMIVVVATFSHILQEFYLTRILGAVPPQEKIDLATYIIRDGAVLMLVISLSVALKMVAAWRTQERARARLEAEKRSAELAGLRSQLNPHFLFNTLNNIYSLTLSDGEKAREAIHSLGTILRYVLYTDAERVPLASELDFVRGYVALMRLRTGTGMRVEVSLPSEGEGLSIAPLLMMPLVENAFKHGSSGEAGAEPFVRIDISVREGILVIEVSNSDFPKSDTDRSGSGIGLDNLRRRLALLYPAAHTLTLERSGGVHTASLSIKLF
jgi:sensor histidine kinase YesM